jgi:hypothetical protein
MYVLYVCIDPSTYKYLCIFVNRNEILGEFRRINSLYYR